MANNKLTTYIIVFSGLMLLFYFMGLLDEAIAGNSVLLDMLLTPEGFQTSPLRTQMFLVLNGVAVAGIIIGAVIGRNIKLVVMAPFTIWLFNLFLDFLHVFAKIWEANPVLAVLFMGPLMILYCITLVEWVMELT